MERENEQPGGQQPQSTEGHSGRQKNPFNNGQPVEKELAAAEEQLDNEHQFKEAATERD